MLALILWRSFRLAIIVSVADQKKNARNQTIRADAMMMALIKVTTRTGKGALATSKQGRIDLNSKLSMTATDVRDGRQEEGECKA